MNSIEQLHLDQTLGTIEIRSMFWIIFATAGLVIMLVERQQRFYLFGIRLISLTAIIVYEVIIPNKDSLLMFSKILI